MMLKACRDYLALLQNLPSTNMLLNVKHMFVVPAFMKPAYSNQYHRIGFDKNIESSPIYEFGTMENDFSVAVEKLKLSIW